MTDKRDIVKRLRLQPEDIGGPSRMEMLRERAEAADEIERLRGIEAALGRSGLDFLPCMVCGEPVVRLPVGVAMCESCYRDLG